MKGIAVRLILVLAAIAIVYGCANRHAHHGRTVGSVPLANGQKEKYKSVESLKAQYKEEAKGGLVFRKLIHGNPKVKAIALTFDDGPHPKYTPQLLAILKKYHIKATFFVIGKMAKKYSYLVKDDFDAGQLIANHTYNHVNLTKIPEAQVREEWAKNDQEIKSIIGVEMQFCRPPGGDYNKRVMNAAMDERLTTVLWTDDPGDYAKPGDKTIVNRVLGRIHNGGIILLHDGVQQTVDVLPKIITTLQKRGYKFQTVEEMEKATQ